MKSNYRNISLIAITVIIEIIIGAVIYKTLKIKNANN
jgi:hypothetical protein